MIFDRVTDKLVPFFLPHGVCVFNMFDYDGTARCRCHLSFINYENPAVQPFRKRFRI